MRAWLAAALAACWTAPVAPTPLGGEPMDCHLTTERHRIELACMARNTSSAPREVCAVPYVGVRETGAIYAPHEPACSTELAPGELEPVWAPLDIQAELCAPERGGCTMQAFLARDDGSVNAAAVVGFARSLQAGARFPGRDRPSLRECDDLVDRWSHSTAFASYRPFVHGDPDDVRVFCLGLPRAMFECLRAAPDAARADVCNR